MSQNKTTTPPDWDALYNALLGGVSSEQEIDMPQLGRVTFRSAADLYQMLSILRQEQARASGAAPGVFVVGHDRGLSPNGGC